MAASLERLSARVVAQTYDKLEPTIVCLPLRNIACLEKLRLELTIKAQLVEVCKNRHFETLHRLLQINKGCLRNHIIFEVVHEVVQDRNNDAFEIFLRL